MAVMSGRNQILRRRRPTGEVLPASGTHRQIRARPSLAEISEVGVLIAIKITRPTPLRQDFARIEEHPPPRQFGVKLGHFFDR
jgi:hypothetical protein